MENQKQAEKYIRQHFIHQGETAFLASAVTDALIDLYVISGSNNFGPAIGMSLLKNKSSLYVRDADGYRLLSRGLTENQAPMKKVDGQGPLDRALQVVIAKDEGVWAARRCVWETGRFEASAI
eukprot:GHVU01034141.1.p1 GENE.GHVU01034141.1~~GHVU01034141.1.p1  ORF type:complete len:123 (-),score=7.87 GHVU01034141.1:104-472(-)